MKLKVLLFLFAPFFCWSQDSIAWKLHWELKELTSPIWNIDAFGNIILAEKDNIRKLDSTGRQLFVQSSKNLGVISSIDPSNPMKTLVFSEQQQIVSYIDNTLSKQQEIIELDEFELSYVTLIATSAQPDKFWIYDQDNSKIVLISKNELQRQRIENTQGLLGCKDILQLFEHEKYLYLIDKQKGIFQFDMYGTLTNRWEISGINWLQIEGNYAYFLSDGSMQIYHLNDLTSTTFQIPKDNYLRFKKHGNSFVFSTLEGLEKYSIEIVK